MNLYTVYDTVAAMGGPIFTARNDGVALRQFQHMITSEKVSNILEYKLLKLATYDEENPKVVGIEVETITPNLNTEIEDDGTGIQ